MAEQDTRADTEGKAVFNDQLHDILLVMDMEEMTLKAVKDIDKNGKIQTTDADRGANNNFLDIDQNGNLVDNFLKNFYRQAKDPTRFQFFKVPVNKLKETVQSLKELFKADPSSKSKKVAEQYKVDPEEGIQKKQDEKPEITNQNENSMAKTTTENAPTQQGPRTRFNEAMINWDELGRLGISKEYLQEKNMLDGMLRGYKSRETVPINLNVGSAVIKTDARLSFQQSKEGPVVMAIHGIRKEPELDRPYFGHIFSEEDKKNLKETGHLGRVVDLYDKSNQMHPSFISIDPLTKEITSVRAKSVYIPMEVSGVKLMEHEREDLRNGKEIFVDGMVAKSGKEFDAYLRVDANERRVTYRFEEGLSTIKKIGGVELNEQQKQDLVEGKVILVEGMANKQTGELRDSYVKAADLATGKLQFTNFNPDSPEEKREIIIPRSIGQVELTKEDRQELSEGKAIFLKDQVKVNGDTYDSFVRLHPATGDIQRSRTPDGFSEDMKIEIPKEISGVKVTAKMKAEMQDGKVVEIKGAKGTDGTLVPTFVKLNKDTGLLNFYRDNPDKAKKATIGGDSKETKSQQAPAQDQKKPRSRKVN